MMPEPIQTEQKQICPKCSSQNVKFSDKRKTNVCIDCLHEFTVEKNIPHRRIFLSYGHDEYSTLAGQIKKEMLDAFGSLFSVSNNRIQHFHKSVIDWLTDENKAGNYFISAEEGHKYLADHGWKEILG